MNGEAFISGFPVSVSVLVLASGLTHALTEGVAGRCIVDSVYLSNADTLGFRFEGKATP